MNLEDTYDSLVEQLRLAQKIVDRAQVHDSVTAAAFTEVFRSLNGQVAGGEASSDHDRRATRLDHVKLDGDFSSERLAAVADAFRVDPTVVSQIFAEEDGDLLFVLPSRRLANTTRGAMRQIVILVACGRQAGGWDDAWTASATLRDACESAQVYSSKHFNAIVDSLEMFAVRGNGSSRQLRAHAASYAAARAVLVQLDLQQDTDP